MGKCGRKKFIWTKEMTDKLLEEISKGRTYCQLAIMFKSSQPTIWRKIKDMGFDGLIDARLVLTDY